MHDTVEHMVKRVLPDVPIRQYVLSPPSLLVGLLAARADAWSALSRIFVEAVSAGIGERSLRARGELHTGSLLFAQRFTYPFEIQRRDFRRRMCDAASCRERRTVRIRGSGEARASLWRPAGSGAEAT